MAKVSVIMPVYNGANFIKESIESVLGQSYADIELVVIDDASTDSSIDIARAFLKDRRFRLIAKHKREGPGAARNAGLDMADGEFIAFLDADDLFLRNKIETQVNYLLKEGNGGCISYTNEIFFKVDTHKRIKSNRCHFQGDIFFYLKRSNFIQLSSVMARADLLKRYRFNESPDVIGHEDWELCLRLARDRIRFLYMDEPLIEVRIREDSLTGSRHMDKSRRSVGLMARRYWKDFKKDISISSPKGAAALFRYTKFKTFSFLIGFPKRRCFNEPSPLRTEA